MALTIKNLGAVTFNTGTALAASLTYQPAAGKCALVKNIVLTNKHASSAATINVTLVVKADVGTQLGTTNLCPSNMSVAANNSVVLDTEITLTYVDATYQKLVITVESGSALPVGVTINGIERDI